MGCNLPEALEFYMQHGWGFNASCWRRWQDEAPPGSIWMLCDRGYFGSPAVVADFQSGNAFHVVVAHSFGLHLVPPIVLRRADMLVVMGAFERFSTPSMRAIGKMIIKLDDQPDIVLGDFYSRCYAEADPPDAPSRQNTDLLREDLSMLANQKLNLELLRTIPRVLILHGAKDKIIAPEQARSLHDSLIGSELYFHPDAGHALPFTHVRWCLGKIVAAIESVHERPALVGSNL